VILATGGDTQLWVIAALVAVYLLYAIRPRPRK